MEVGLVLGEGVEVWEAAIWEDNEFHIQVSSAVKLDDNNNYSEG